MNVYMPPSRATKLKSGEIAEINWTISVDCPNHELIIDGDFNFPDDNRELSEFDIKLTNIQELPQIEQRTFTMVQQHGLNQRNLCLCTNSRGTFLDLVFTTKEISNVDLVG